MRHIFAVRLLKTQIVIILKLYEFYSLFVILVSYITTLESYNTHHYSKTKLHVTNFEKSLKILAISFHTSFQL